jgi:hypothetical protein
MKSTQWKQVVRKKDCMVPRKSDGYHIIFMRKVLVRECGKVEQERPLGEAVDKTKRKERLKSGLTQGSENDESKRFSNNRSGIAETGMDDYPNRTKRETSVQSF